MRLLLGWRALTRPGWETVAIGERKFFVRIYAAANRRCGWAAGGMVPLARKRRLNPEFWRDRLLADISSLPIVRGPASLTVRGTICRSDAAAFQRLRARVSVAIA